jgi:AraC family transcriptional activator FtrA
MIVDFLPKVWDDGAMPLKCVAVLVPEDTAPFEFGVLHEVFGIDRTDDGVPPFDFRVCAVRPGIPMGFGSPAAGMQLIPTHGMDAAREADLVAVPACRQDVQQPAELLQALRDAQRNGAIVLSVCSGAFVLGAAGLLDGRSCTTHWRYAEKLAAEFPLAKVNREVLFVDEGNLITSAGTAAGIDACLHLVRREMGSAVATRIARRMVVPPQRDGGQRQFIELPIPECVGDSLEPVLSYLVEHLADDHPVRELAGRAAMSERTFARRFVAETGSTPAKWLALQRLHHASRLLEETELGIEQVAARCGFSTAAQLRHHFTRAVGVPPGDYRRSFAARVSGSGSDRTGTHRAGARSSQLPASPGRRAVIPRSAPPAPG